MMVKRKASLMLFMIIIVTTMLMNVCFYNPIIILGEAAIGPGNEPEHWDNSTTLNVTVLELNPRINWYDFQYNDSGTWVSKRNAMIDVDNSTDYRFIVNISSDQGWDDIDFINITAWHDNGSDTSIYNDTTAGGYGNKGANRNLRLTYENISGTAYYNLTWPTTVVIQGSMDEITSTDGTYGSLNHTECHNISFKFTPGYQFRYAPGDGWTNSSIEVGSSGNRTHHDDIWSWNFNITVTDNGENNSGQRITTWANDEFGVYAYSQIASVGWPVITGNPGENSTAESEVTITTRSNGNYSLSVNVTNLTHIVNPSYTISNETVWVKGGNLSTSTNFSHDVGGSSPLFLHGSDSIYNTSEFNGTEKIINGIEYKCAIPFGQQTGEYRATIFYHLKTQT